MHASASSSVELGDVDNQYEVNFKADADAVLITEAEELLQLTAYPEVLTDMMVSPILLCRFDFLKEAVARH